MLRREARAWRDAIRSYAVLIDGNNVAKIRRGQIIEFPVASGKHKIFLKINWCSSPVIEVDAKPGEVINLFCSPGGTPTQALGQALTNTGSYIQLTRILRHYRCRNLIRAA
jgi:hypothetical protein